MERLIEKTPVGKADDTPLPAAWLLRRLRYLAAVLTSADGSRAHSRRLRLRPCCLASACPM